MRRQAVGRGMGNLDLLEDAAQKLPHTTRKMFGGHGLFAPNGGMFAGIVTDDEIALKFADEAARAEFEAFGGHAWVYRTGGREMTMKEWIVIPDALYDDPRQLAQWTARAHKLVPGRTGKARPAVKGAKEAKGAKSKPTVEPGTTKPAAKKAASSAPAKKGAPAAVKKAPAKKVAPKKAGAKKVAGKKAAAKKPETRAAASQKGKPAKKGRGK